MSFVIKTNNRVVANNARASDVARKAVDEIVQVQQQKTLSAMRVQGFQGILYNRLTSGMPCTCQSERRTINSLLDEEGKASTGTINQLLTGESPTRFGIRDYGAFRNQDHGPSPLDGRDPRTGLYPLEILTPLDPEKQKVEATRKFHEQTRGQLEGNFDLVKSAQEMIESFDSPEDQDQDSYRLNTGDEGATYGDNGPLPDLDLDSLVGDQDLGHFSFADTGCPICYGTGKIGGYQIQGGQRRVFIPSSPEVQLDDQSEMLTVDRPWAARSMAIRVSQMLFPKGARGIDAFQVWNRNQRVGSVLTVDGQILKSWRDLPLFCDGQPHVLQVTLVPNAQDKSLSEGRVTWTHLEIQWVYRREPMYFEFPKLQSSQDTSLLELTEPFQIILGPNIQQVEPMDIIVENTYGKVLVVQNANPWNDKRRDALGQEVQVRPVQPQELLNLLPRRTSLLGEFARVGAPYNPVRHNLRGPAVT